MQTTTAARATPINCYECHKELRWRMRDTPIGIVGHCQCCGSDYLFHDSKGKTLPEFARRKKPSKALWLIPLAIMGVAAYVCNSD